MKKYNCPLYWSTKLYKPSASETQCLKELFQSARRRSLEQTTAACGLIKNMWAFKVIRALLYPSRLAPTALANPTRYVANRHDSGRYRQRLSQLFSL